MKKILTLLLVLTIIAQGCVFSVFAEEKNSTDDFDFICELGLVDGENVFHTDYLKRIQLAEMIFNIVIDKGISFENSGIKCKFADVPEDKSHIVAFVYNMGIMKGCSEYIFDPNGYVTYNQVIKTLVSLLGYDIQAQYYGGYPSGYLTQAAAIGLMKNDGISGDALATIGGVASLLKRAVNVDFCKQDGEKIEILKGVSYLEYYMGIKHESGIVTGNYLTNVSDSRGTSYFGIYIDNNFMFIEKSASGIQNCLGYKINYFYRELNGEKYIFYYEEGKNSALVIDGGDIENAEISRIAYYGGNGKTQYASLSNSMVLIYNGSYLASYTKDDLHPFKNKTSDGKIVLLDNNFDNVYDVVSVYVYETHIVREIKDNKIYSYYSPSQVIDITNYTERNIDIANIEGEPVHPASIKEGHVINVVRDRVGYIKSIIVSRDYATGVIDEITKNGDKVTGVKINGVNYDVSPVLYMHDDGNRIAPGVEVTVYFNCLARITHIDVDSKFFIPFKSGYIIDAHKESGMEGEVSVMIFTSESEMISAKLEKRVKINSETYDAEEIFTKLGTTESGRIERQIILYKTLTEEGNISEIEVADKTGDFSSGFYEFPAKDSLYSEKLRTFKGYFAVEGNVTKVYQVPSEDFRDDYDDYRIVTWPLENATMLNSKAYGTQKEALMADAVVCFVDRGQTQMDSRSPIFVVEKSVNSVDDSGEVKVKITGAYVDGTTYGEGSFYADTETLKKAFAGQIPQAGDIFRVNSFAKSGKGTQFTPLFDYSEQKCFFTNPAEETHRYVYGTVSQKVGSIIRLNVFKSQLTEVHSLVGDSYRIIEVKTDRNGNVVSAKSGSTNCVIDDYTHPSEGSKAFIYARGGVGISIIVYN